MYTLKGKAIKIGNDVKPIIKFEVWWRTPTGLTCDLEEAINVVESYDMDPNLVIEAVVAAVAADGSYEIL